MLSARQNPTVVDVYVAFERAEYNLLGLFLVVKVHISHMRVIPKKSQLGQWLMIADLSYP